MSDIFDSIKVTEMNLEGGRAFGHSFTRALLGMALIARDLVSMNV